MTEGRLSGALAWAHPLQPLQGAVSFASRLASLNGRPLGLFLRDMAIHPRDVDRAKEEAVRRLAELGSADPGELVRHTPRPLDEKRWQLAGHPLYRLSFGRTVFRYCPLCILEDLETVEGPIPARPWLRMEWTISHFRSCRVHGSMLSGARPHRLPFAPYDFAATVSGLVPDMPREARKAVAVPASPFEVWLRCRIAGSPYPQGWLDSLDLNVAISFCEWLGVSALHPPKVQTSRLAPLDWARAADEGFSVANAGEKAIRELLDRLNAAQRETRGVWGPRDTIGPVYGVLERTQGDGAWKRPRELVADFVVASLPIAPGASVLGRKVDARRVHTIHTAARASRTHVRTVRRLMERKVLASDGADPSLRDHRVVLEADEIAATLVSLKGAMTTPEVVRRTGIPLPWLRTIVSDGHLPSVSGSVGLRWAKHRFRPEDVGALMDRIFDGCVDVAATDDDHVPVAVARHRAVASHETVLQMLFDGHLAWKGRLAGAKGFAALLVDTREVVRLVREAPPRDGLSRRAVLDHIPGLARDSVDVLVGGGHLAETDEFSPDARRLTRVVTRESADRFVATHVSLGELVGRSGLHHKQVRKILRLAGIGESLDSDRVGCFFYDRERVATAERKDPHFWLYERR